MFEEMDRQDSLDKTVILNEEQYNTIVNEIKKVHSNLKSLATTKEIHQPKEEPKPIQPQITPQYYNDGINRMPQPTVSFPMEKTKKPKRILKLLIGGIIGLILATGLLIALYAGDNLSFILSFIIAFVAFIIFSLVYTFLIFILTKPKSSLEFQQGINTEVCPYCRSKLIKDKIVQDGSQIKQLIRCSNPMCRYQNEIIYNQ